MPDMSEKSRWNAVAPRPPAPAPARRGLAKRDLLAIVAGSVAIAGLGVAAWQAGGDHEGVSLRGGAGGTGVDLSTVDGAAWQGTAGNAVSPSNVPAAPADPSLVAETREEHARQTAAFRAVLTPSMRNGSIAGFVLGDGPVPALFARAGLKPGDVLLSVNGLGFQSQGLVDDLSYEIAGSQTAEFVVERDGRKLTLSTRIRG